jgi:two-component system, NarL family, sensor histidine kinase UhpB
MTTLDRRGDDRRTTLERLGPAALRVSLYWRVFAVNAAILSTAVMLLIVTPVTIDARPTPDQLLVLAGGLLLMLVANAWLVRFSLRPLRRLSELMSVVDVLEPGRRLDATATAEVAAVISTFNSTLDRLEGERRASMHRVLAAQEAERRRIAQELHDQIGQNLTAVVLELKRVRARIDAGEAEALADAQELARESLEELRRISYELRPAALDDLGLASALASLCSGIERRTGIAVELEVADDLPTLDGQVELAVYRVAQEALTNSARHARCTTVHVALGTAGDDAVLRVSDDGIGMDGSLPGGGLRGMRERAVAIGATLETGRSGPGGVVVSMRVPAAAAGA